MTMNSQEKPISLKTGKAGMKIRWESEKRTPGKAEQVYKCCEKVYKSEK
jgi:hypothetical protein